ncbi:MAG: tetraacyldisaccharide 4'-kinase [Cyclobacteriaceae bacterium]
MTWWQILLFPFAIIYDLITRFRNHLFDIGSNPSFEFEANVICVGNLAVGGTGKTPMVMYLMDHFISQNMQIATLSRGYGRKTAGFIEVGEKDTPRAVGDEPLMLFNHYNHSNVSVNVGENRAMSIPEILWEHPKNDVIILDDGYQHRTVIPTFSVLLTTFEKPFYSDYVLPSGTLRECRKNANRANAIVVTKCPPHAEEAIPDMRAELSKWTDAPVFFTEIHYGALVPLFKESKDPITKVLLVTAIANDKSLIEFLSSRYEVVGHLRYRDHHDYKKKDISKMCECLNQGEITLITTEKDAVKLSRFDELRHFSAFYMPISMKFIEGEHDFLSLIDESLKEYQR